MLQGIELDKYKRIHYLPSPRSLDEASEFIANTLLLSHGIRRDTLSIVTLKCCTLLAPGDRLRQLRPDYETRTGWIRAVLRGKHRGLGAVLDYEHSTIEYLMSMDIAVLIVVYYSKKIWIKESRLKEILEKDRPILVEYFDANSVSADKGVLGAPYSPGVTGAIVNIYLDNIMASENS